MLEQQRLDYLQAMGIVQWMPRQPLPGAPAPRWLPVQAAHAPHPHQISSGEGHIVHPMAAELLHDKAPPEARQEQPSVRPGVADLPAADPGDATVAAEIPVQAADLTPPRFELHFLRVSRCGVWVCDDAAQAEAMQAFAWRVMMAMTDHTGFMQPLLRFRWPFIESAHDDQSQPVALQALSAQWRFFTEQGAAYAVCFGEDSQTWLSRVGVKPVYHSAAVTGVMQSAADKRLLWQALKDITEL